jgi:hypothetical protein
MLTRSLLDLLHVSLPIQRLVVIGLGLTTCAAEAIAVGQADQGFVAAKTEYERSATKDEAARVRYVTQLAKLADGFVTKYRTSGERHDKEMTAINAELAKHPMPPNADAKKLSHLLIGKWDSPRRTYVFRANGTCGSLDGPVSTNWQIKGNQLIQDDSHGTTILLDAHYFIYLEDGSVFFHSRVKE